MIVLKWNRSAEKGYFLLHTNENFDHWFGWTWAINTRETANRNSIGRNSVERKKKELGNWNALAPSEIFIYGERVLFFFFRSTTRLFLEVFFPCAVPVFWSFSIEHLFRTASRCEPATFGNNSIPGAPVKKKKKVADDQDSCRGRHLKPPWFTEKPSKTQ